MKCEYQWKFLKCLNKTENQQDLCQASISVKIGNLLNCFCSFDFSCPILEKDNFINLFLLYCQIAFFFNLPDQRLS